MDVPVVEAIRWVIDDVVIDSPVSSDRVLFLERNIVFLPVNISDNVAYQCDVNFEANTDFVNYGNTELYLNVEGKVYSLIHVYRPFNQSNLFPVQFLQLLR